LLQLSKLRAIDLGEEDTDDEYEEDGNEQLWRQMNDAIEQVPKDFNQNC
jgi:hypothetical protein